MAGVPLPTMPAPDGEYLSKSELAKWLRLETWEIDPRIRAGLIPMGEKRPGKTMFTWTREAAAVAKFNLDNIRLYPGAEERLAAELAKLNKEQEE